LISRELSREVPKFKEVYGLAEHIGIIGIYQPAYRMYPGMHVSTVDDCNRVEQPMEKAIEAGRRRKR
jgi:hypothetical protein